MNKQDVINLAGSIFTALISWPMVVLVGFFVFRRQLKALIVVLTALAGRIKKANIGSVTVETIETVVGRTNISAVPTRFESDSLAFRSQRYGFDISYPADLKMWAIKLSESEIDQPEIVKSLGQVMVFTIVSKIPYDDFSPNVNILIQPVGDMTITGYAAKTINEFAKLGIKLISYELDLKTNGAAFSYIVFLEKGQLACVARVTLSRGLALLATSTQNKASNLPDDVRHTLNSILNSFHAIEKDTDEEAAH